MRIPVRSTDPFVCRDATIGSAARVESEAKYPADHEYSLDWLLYFRLVTPGPLAK